MEQQRESLNGSNIMLLGMEKIDGTECYKVRVIPDMKVVYYSYEGAIGNHNDLTLPERFIAGIR